MINSQVLEDLTLVLLGDAHAHEAWFSVWVRSYPSVRVCWIDEADDAEHWYEQVQAACNDVGSVMLVAHGLGANAAATWYARSDVNTHKRVIAVILLAPVQHTKQALPRAYFQCPTAWVVSEHDMASPSDWGREQANAWHARFFVLSNEIHAQRRQNWAWGMKLMQEMLL